MKKRGINAEWHRTHRMPKTPTLEQRLEWHLEHQEKCACRELPESIRKALAQRSASREQGA
ncbi:MAG TPA: hypothetical protein VF167_07100 [Longimicrobiaceae bacterium]